MVLNAISIRLSIRVGSKSFRAKMPNIIFTKIRNSLKYEYHVISIPFSPRQHDRFSRLMHEWNFYTLNEQEIIY